MNCYVQKQYEMANQYSYVLPRAREDVQKNTIWVPDKFHNISIGDTLNFWLEDGTPVTLTVSGIFSQTGIQDETFGSE